MAVGSQRDRDRDSGGRPRNARPRDALGRPLPHGAAGVAGVPDDLVLPPAESLRLAQELLDTGRAFQAHEVLEGTWKSAPDNERELWRGLAQFAVGITHTQRGNAVGAVRLLRRAATRVEAYVDGPPYGINAAGLITWAVRTAGRIEADGVDALQPNDLVPQLCG